MLATCPARLDYNVHSLLKLLLTELPGSDSRASYPHNQVHNYFATDSNFRLPENKDMWKVNITTDHLLLRTRVFYIQLLSSHSWRRHLHRNTFTS